MPKRPVKAFSFAILLWLIGLVWGSVVFMSPALKSAPAIPFVSSNPWISFPILLAWLPASYVLARSYLRFADVPAAEGRRLGLVFAVVNIALDLVVLVVFFNTGFQYFASLTVLAGYALLLLVPWAVGRRVERTELR
jgi:hypothetical protein